VQTYRDVWCFNLKQKRKKNAYLICPQPLLCSSWMPPLLQLSSQIANPKTNNCGIVQQLPKECLPRRSLHRMNVYSKVHGPIMMEPPRGTSGLRRSSNKRCILMRHYLRKAAAFASCHVLTNVALWRSKHAVWLLFLNLVLRCGKSQRDLRQLCFMA